jgi:DNA-binding IclR family transcriptional regulator
VPVAQLFTVFLRAPARPRYLGELTRLTGMADGTARQALRRMREQGWVTADHEQGRTRLESNRRLRLYSITQSGTAAAPSQLKEAQGQVASISRALGIAPPAPSPGPARRAPRPRGPAARGGRAPGLTAGEARVVRALLAEPRRARYNAELARLAGLAQSSTLKAVGSLAGRGWVQGGMAEMTARGRGSGRKLTAYSLTLRGLDQAPGALVAVQASAATAAAALGPAQADAPAGTAGRAAGGTANWRAERAAREDPTARVIAAFLADPGQPRHHAGLMSQCGLPSTTVHMVLARLAGKGWLTLVPLRVMAGPGTRTVRGHVISQAGLEAAPGQLDAIRARAARIEAARDGPAPAVRTGLPALATALVMRALIAVPGRVLCYAELAERTGVPENTLRPALQRMTRDGLVSSVPELASSRAGASGRPRLLYCLTPIGEKVGPTIVDAARRQVAAVGGPPGKEAPGLGR